METRTPPLCVIFDLDGTLCDTNDVDGACYRDAAAATLRVPSCEIDWTNAPHHTDSGIARWLWERFRGRAPTREDLGRLEQDFLRRLEVERVSDAGRFRPIREAPQYIERLRCAGTVVGIGTGGWRASAELKLAMARLDTSLLYATADDAEARVEIFSLAWARAREGLERFSVTVLVGDSIWDVATASELGWRFLGVGVGIGASRLRQAGATVVVPHYAGLDVGSLMRAQVPLKTSLQV